MKTFRLNKLVRDSELNWIEQNHGISQHKFLNRAEKIKALREKLEEETQELLDASSQDEKLAEFADVFEVLYELAEALEIKKDDIEKKRQQKRERRGGFDQGVFIETVSYPEDSKLTTYLLSQPTKSPVN